MWTVKSSVFFLFFLYSFIEGIEGLDGYHLKADYIRALLSRGQIGRVGGGVMVGGGSGVRRERWGRGRWWRGMPREASRER